MLARLRWFRAHTEVAGQILRDLKPLILLIGLAIGGLIFGDGVALHQLVALLAK